MDGDPLVSRLSRLCVLPSGRLPGLALHDHAARAALLIDLALWGRISRTSQASFVDTTPTGFEPADRLLGYIDAHPDLTMQRVLAKAPVRMAYVLDPSAELRRRWPWRRGTCVSANLIAAEQSRLEQTAAGDIDSVRSAAVAMLASALRLIVLTEPETVLGECADIAWLVKDCVDYLNEVRVRYDMVAAAGRGGGGG